MEYIHSDLPRHACGGLESDESVFHLKRHYWYNVYRYLFIQLKNELFFFSHLRLTKNDFSDTNIPF